MPIYAYKCAACGHEKDVLQKISDEPLTVCPSCGAASFSKQVTAAGFQLKGSGWYVTDFRDGGKKKDSSSTDSGNKAGNEAASAAPSASDSPAPSGDSKAAHAASPAPSPAAPAPAPAAPPPASSK